MTEKEKKEIFGNIEPNFNTNLANGTIKINLDYYNCLEEYIRRILDELEQKDKEIQELKKYDIRNIKIDKDKIISSPSFTRKEVDLMNLGIALSLNADKLFNDESEEDDI